MKLKKGSAAAKAYMAKIRAARGKTKPVAKAKTKAKAKKTTKKIDPNKIGYKDDRTKILKKSSEYINAYLKKGYNRKEAVAMANLEAAHVIQSNMYVRGIKKVGAYKKPVLFKPTKKQTAAAAQRLVKETMHKDTKSHNVNIRVMSGNKNTDGLKKLSGVAPHKGKYFIVYKRAQIENTEYFDKLPAGRYKGMDNIIYLMRGTDSGTALIPLIEAKSNKPVKR